MKKLFTLLAATFIGNFAFAQIPNPGFESWTSMGSYSTPDGWDSPDSATSAFSTYTCTQGTPGFAGSSYLKLVSKAVPIVGTVPGVAVSGKIDFTTGQPKSGFACSVRPVSLTGEWQHMAYGTDTGHIVVFLSKWNTALSQRDTVAFIDTALSGMAMSWASFTIPLNYHSPAFPDSGIIVLTASGATAVVNSYLYVDNLAFTGTVPSGINEVSTHQMDATINPNPAKNTTTVVYSCNEMGLVSIDVVDITGRVINSVTTIGNIGSNNFTINTANYAKGIYYVKIGSAVGNQTLKLVIE